MKRHVRSLHPDPESAGRADVGEVLGASILEALRTMPPRYNVAPTQAVPIIVVDRSGPPQLLQARWGYIPGWWKKPVPPTLTTNARSETAATKPMWSGAWKH
jgi:putative SOS response-associated peptidase YedK